MKLLISCLLTIFIFNLPTAQDCNILNTSHDLEINTNVYPLPYASGARAFFTGRIINWYSSHQSPHLITDDGNGGCTQSNITNEATAYKCMGSSFANGFSTTERDVYSC